MRKVLKIVLIVALLIGIVSTGFYYIFFNAHVKVSTNNIGNIEMTQKQKLEDFEYMYNIMKNNFPYFEVKKRTLGYDWLSHKSEFERWIKSTKNDVEFYDTMNRILLLLQNGHTHILSPEYYSMFVKIYGKIPFSGPWNQVLNNKNVTNRYKYWGKLINEKTYVIPVVFKYFEGNYAAICDINKDDPKKYGIGRGSILKKVGDLTIDEYINSLRDKAFLQYDFKRNILKKDQLLIYTKNIENINLTLLTPDGKTVEKELKSIEYVQPKSGDNLKIPNYQNLVLKDKKIAYLKVISFNGLSVNKDHDGIYKFLKSIKDYPYLIIDIRGNGGGDDNYWKNNIVQPLIDKQLSASYYTVIRKGDYIKPFFKARYGPSFYNLKSTKELPGNLNFPDELKRDFGRFSYSEITVSPKDPVGFKGKIFLLTDGYVYSSAESFAAFAKATKWATLVGTTTGGDGIGIDPVLCALPNSGLVFRFSADMGINPDGSINEEKHTSPDIYIEQTYKDYFESNEIDSIKNDLNDIIKYDTVIKKVIDMAK